MTNSVFTFRTLLYGFISTADFSQSTKVAFMQCKKFVASHFSNDSVGSFFDQVVYSVCCSTFNFLRQNTILFSSFFGFDRFKLELLYIQIEDVEGSTKGVKFFTNFVKSIAPLYRIHTKITSSIS